mgnify:CR=1 FL=1
MMSEQISITDIVEFNPKRTVKKGTVAPFIEMAALPTSQRDVNYILQKELASGGAKFTNGDTLFARITPCLENGKTALVSGLKENINGFGSTEFIVMSPKYPEYDSKFIYYLARHPEFRDYAKAHMEGTSGRQRVSWQSLSEFKYSFPEKDERKKIGDLLSKLDDKISNNTTMNATLEKIAQRIFKSWFVDFDPVKANAEGVPFDGLSPEIQSLFPNEFEESELGMIPKGWEVKKSNQLFDVAIGKTPPRKEHQWFSKSKKDITWISIKDMGTDGVYNLSSSECLTSEAVEKFNVKLIPENTVILSFKLTVGRVAITFEESTTNEAIAHFKKSDKSYLSSEFLYSYLKAFNFDQLGSTSSIATAVNSKIIKDLNIIEPVKEVSKAYDLIISPLFMRIKNNQQMTDSLIKIRDKLLPRLISGKITIQKAEEMLEEAI